jgi:hypothetical protein
MRKVLSLLLAFVFMQVQAHALSGGPVFGSGNATGALNVIGTYGGVLRPGSGVVDSEGGGDATTGQDNSQSTSIGLFSFGVPDAGPATGGVVVFVEGTAFNGILTGVADPLDGAFSGIIDAISTYTISFIVQTGFDAAGNPIFQTIDTNVFAQGNMEAQITSLTGGIAVDPLTGVNSGTTRIEGTASIDIFYQLEADGTPAVSNTVTYDVTGFKQSDTAQSVTFDVGADIDTGTDDTGNG